jgi:hypothetical protein
VAYQYGAPRPAWALEVIRRAEAAYGKPQDRDFEAA